MIPEVLGDITLGISQYRRRLSPRRRRGHACCYIGRDGSPEERPDSNHLIVPLHRQNTSSLFFEVWPIRRPTPFGDSAPNETYAANTFVGAVGVLQMARQIVCGEDQ
jgi:hypothetical protein